MPKSTSLVSWGSALVAALFCLEAPAVQPPDMPLPECVYVAGRPAGGACPQLNDYVGGNATGRFATGVPVTVRTVPFMPVCDSWNAHTLVASPSGCYSSVSSPTVVSCGTFDLRTEQYYELPCGDALYKPGTRPATLFTQQRPADHGDPYSSMACGATPAYHTYVYGGDATNEEHVWRTRGPKALACEVTLAGPRPNGLYGPTWVKLRVRVTRGESGIFYPGPSQQAEFYVPVDGDLRNAADVSVNASASLTEVNWDADRLFATYKGTVTNHGEADAENVSLTVKFPGNGISIIDTVTGAGCTKPESTSPGAQLPQGGVVTCNWARLAGHDSREVEIVARIINATDLHSLQTGEIVSNDLAEPRGVLLKVKADNDTDTRDNEMVVKIDIPFRAGSYVETRALMESLAPYFDYQTDKYREQCNVYKDDISARLQQIHADNPGVFASLSYGGVTSGRYLIAGLDTAWTRAGHVGVVVYAKGTNYRETGIVINGTPSPSPLNAVSEIGPDDPGFGFGVAGWTAANGWYLRTPANEFPGKIRKEGRGLDGFEGLYPHNSTEFTSDGLPASPEPVESESCPIAPDAVMIATESPVEIVATNSRGERVETRDGEVVVQELETSIHSMAFPHDDGTYAWTLVLPVDDYDVQVVGTRTGPYKLILATFDADGTMHEQVTEGHTSVGQIDEYALEAPEKTDDTPTDPPPATPPPSGGPGATPTKRGGGGAFDATLLMLLLACGWSYRHRLTVARH